jgi:hypothetical protein
MSDSVVASTDDYSQEPLEEWLSLLEANESKPAVRELLNMLQGMDRPQKFEVLRGWKRPKEYANDRSEALALDREKGSSIDDRHQSQPGYRDLINDEEYRDALARLKAARTKYHSLAAKRGWNLIVGCLELLPEEWSRQQDALAELERAKKLCGETVGRLERMYGITRQRPNFPKGWRGDEPSFDIQTAADVFGYLEQVLESGVEVKKLNDAIYNACRALRTFGIPGTPSIEGLPFAKRRQARDFITGRILSLKERTDDTLGVGAPESLAEESTVLKDPQGRDSRSPEKARKKSTAKRRWTREADRRDYHASSIRKRRLPEL